MFSTRILRNTIRLHSFQNWLEFLNGIFASDRSDPYVGRTLSKKLILLSSSGTNRISKEQSDIFRDTFKSFGHFSIASFQNYWFHSLQPKMAFIQYNEKPDWTQKWPSGDWRLNLQRPTRPNCNSKSDCAKTYINFSCMSFSLFIYDTWKINKV